MNNDFEVVIEDNTQEGKDQEQILDSIQKDVMPDKDQLLKELNETSDIVEKKYTPMRVMTKDNVEEFIHSTTERSQVKKLSLIVRGMVRDLHKIQGIDNKKIFATSVFRNFILFTDIIKNNFTIAKVIKAKFNEYIIEHQMTNLIPIYDKIFNDDLYKDIELPPGVDFISEEEVEEIKANYRNQMRDIIARKVGYRKKTYIYEEGEIVGAQAKDGAWWMSQVKKVFSYKNKYFYYVSYLGWGDDFDELITDPFKIRQFNPRRHKYYRPAWRRKQLEENILPDALVKDTH